MDWSHPAKKVRNERNERNGRNERNERNEGNNKGHTWTLLSESVNSFEVSVSNLNPFFVKTSFNSSNAWGSGWGCRLIKRHKTQSKNVVRGREKKLEKKNRRET